MPVTSSLLTTLRAHTAQVHARLEAELNLLRPPLSQPRVQVFLERLFGFHTAWEPAVQLALPTFETTTKLGLLRQDLLVLGAVPRDIEALPTCQAADRLAATRQAVMGALYVVEGSALGGVVIGRALAADGWPALSYFDAEGRASAAAWRRLQDMLAEVPVADYLAVADGAHAAFELMSDWLAPARPLV